MESEANQVVDHVRSKARSQAEAYRFRQELEHQAQEVLASATHAVSHAEARSRETEALARQEARELQVQLSGARSALGESYDQTRMLQAQVQQLQDEKRQLAARLERIEALSASRTPVPSVATPRQPQASSSAHYPHMAFSPDQASPKAAVQPPAEQPYPAQHSHASLPTEQPVERTAQPARLQALFEGAASGAPELGREGSPTAQPVSSLPQEDDDWVKNFDLFGPGPGFPAQTAPVGVVQDAVAQSPSVEERMNHLTSVVQDLARFVTSGVATQSAQPLEGAAQGAPAASSSDALGAYKPDAPRIFWLKLRATSAAHAGSGPPPDSPSSSSSGSSSSGDEDKPACRMCGSKKHHEKDCPKLTANKRGKKGDPPGSSLGGGGSSSSHGSNAGARRDVATGSATVEKTFAESEEDLKSLSDLTFPSPPENAAQARGYINQVLMAIGKVQRTAGDEVYIWAQECMTLSDTQLKADLRFPRLNREIAAKLIRACRKGRFGLLFQQQVEQERSRSGGMPNGRCMLRAIFRHFQLERDRIGMLAERNLLSTRVAGGSLQDLEDFRDKYQTPTFRSHLPCSIISSMSLISAQHLSRR